MDIKTKLKDFKTKRGILPLTTADQVVKKDGTRLENADGVNADVLGGHFPDYFAKKIKVKTFTNFVTGPQSNAGLRLIGLQTADTTVLAINAQDRTANALMSSNGNWYAQVYASTGGIIYDTTVAVLQVIYIENSELVGD